MVPVDHVARLVIAAAFNQPGAQMSVCHLTSHPRLTFNQYLASLETFGYETPMVDYSEWRAAIERYVETPQDGQEESAL